jgi:hypothetical protein
MGSVTQITQFLFDRDPRSCLTHLSLYHYLKNSMDIGRSYDVELIQEFIDDCLRFEHWQKHSDELISDLNELTQNMVQMKVIAAASVEGLPCTSTQHIALKNTADFEAMVRLYIANHHAKESHFLNLDRGRILGLSLLGDGDLLAEVFRPEARIESGKLRLMAPMTCLRYDRQMDLRTDCKQKLSLNGLQTLFFRRTEGAFHGRTVQAHLFKMVGNLETVHFSTYRDGFMALKEIERHFIEPTSDPYYQELVDSLEQAYHLLHNKRPEGAHFASKIIGKGREALQTIYPKDKLLLLLVTNIEYLLRPQQNQVNSGRQSHVSPQEPKPWHKAKPLPQ